MLNLTKEKIDNVIDSVSKNNLYNVQDQILSVMNKLTKEQQENPVTLAISASYIVQTNIMNTIKDMLYELSGIDD